jgi:hypothetical protein
MEPTGFRRDIMALHALSDLMEKHPELPRPRVELGPKYQSDQVVHVRWFLSAAWNIAVPEWDVRNEEYDDYAARQKEAQRIDLEQRIAMILDAFGEDVEWVKNDPTDDAYYYRLTAVWQDMSIDITTTRDAVCEKVELEIGEHEEEVPDPELHETFLQAVPRVKVTVKDTITEWQCNAALAERTAPKYSVTTKKEVAV